jgi:hypothetical protein
MILDDLEKYLGRFVIYPSEHVSRVAHVLWIAHTHLIDAFEFTARLAVVSAEKKEGKSRLIDVTKQLVRNPISSMNITPAALYTAIKEREPTLLLDETDNLFNGDDKELYGLLNAGFQRGGTVLRCSYDAGKRELEDFPAFCPVLFAGIDNGQIPDTLLDRSITILMQRRIGEAERWREIDTRQEAAELKSRLEEWCKSVLDRARAMRPTMPKDIEGRNADKWEPLFTVADLAEGSWGARARKAALTFLADERDDEVSQGIKLLTDYYSIVYTEGKRIRDKIKTEELLRVLQHGRGWWDARWDKPIIDERKLAKLLRPYDIRPRTIRIGSETAKGYDCDDFEPALKRYGIEAIFKKADQEVLSGPLVPLFK